MSSATAALNADLALIAAGDRAAMRRLYGATAPKLFGICVRVALDREAAEDALQETYLRVWLRAGRFDPDRASAMTWLCLVARGVAIDGRRATLRRTNLVDPVGDPPTHEPAAARLDEAHAVTDCIEQLGADQRDPIRSAFFDGYSYAELALRFDVALGTMKSRIRRGLVALKRCLEDG